MRTRRGESHTASGSVCLVGAGELSAQPSRCPRPFRWTKSDHDASLWIFSSVAVAGAGQPHISPPFLSLIELSGLKATIFFSQKYNLILGAETTGYIISTKNLVLSAFPGHIFSEIIFLTRKIISFNESNFLFHSPLTRV